MMVMVLDRHPREGSRQTAKEFPPKRQFSQI